MVFFLFFFFLPCCCHVGFLFSVDFSLWQTPRPTPRYKRAMEACYVPNNPNFAGDQWTPPSPSDSDSVHQVRADFLLFLFSFFFREKKKEQQQQRSTQVTVHADERKPTRIRWPPSSRPTPSRTALRRRSTSTATARRRPATTSAAPTAISCPPCRPFRSVSGFFLFFGGGATAKLCVSVDHLLHIKNFFDRNGLSGILKIATFSRMIC